MANEKNASKPQPTIIAPPPPEFRWPANGKVSGKLMSAIGTRDMRGATRCIVELDGATVDVPAKYAGAWSTVPAGASVTLSKAGKGRSTLYTLEYV